MLKNSYYDIKHKFRNVWTKRSGSRRFQWSKCAVFEEEPDVQVKTQQFQCPETKHQETNTSDNNVFNLIVYFHIHFSFLFNSFMGLANQCFAKCLAHWSPIGTIVRPKRLEIVFWTFVEHLRLLEARKRSSKDFQYWIYSNKWWGHTVGADGTWHRGWWWDGREGTGRWFIDRLPVPHSETAWSWRLV